MRGREEKSDEKAALICGTIRGKRRLYNDKAAIFPCISLLVFDPMLLSGYYWERGGGGTISLKRRTETGGEDSVKC